MANRKRPRLNITLDLEIKKEIRKVACRLDVPISRLLEFIIAGFLEEYSGRKQAEERLEEKIKSFQGEKTKKARQIESILQEFDGH